MQNTASDPALLWLLHFGEDKHIVLQESSLAAGENALALTWPGVIPMCPLWPQRTPQCALLRAMYLFHALHREWFSVLKIWAPVKAFSSSWKGLSV